MVVLIEATALEADADLAKHLGHILLRPGSATGALWCGVIREGLDLVELFTALLATVLVRGHRLAFCVGATRQNRWWALKSIGAG